MNPDLLSLIIAQLSISELLQLEEASFYRSSVLRELSHRNPIELVLALFPDQEVDWSKASESKWLTPELIVKYADRLDWTALSSNKILSDPKFPTELIGRFESLWLWNRLSATVHLTPELIQEYEDQWEMGKISSNRSLTLEMIKEHGEELDWDMLCGNPVLPLDILQANLHRIDRPVYLSEYPHITINLMEEWIRDEVLKKDDWSGLVHNRFLTEELLEYSIDLVMEQFAPNKVDWVVLTDNPALTARLIDKYAAHLNWHWLSNHPNLTEELIVQHRDKLDMAVLLGNQALTPELILKYHGKLRSYWLSENPAILPVLEQFLPWKNDKLYWRQVSWLVLEKQPELILKHPDWPWDFSVEPEQDISEDSDEVELESDEDPEEDEEENEDEDGYSSLATAIGNMLYELSQPGNGSDLVEEEDAE